MGLDLSSYRGKKFVKPDDVRHKPMEVVIVEVKEGKYGRPDLEFAGNYLLSLNNTNNEVLAKEYGNDSDNLFGKRIRLKLGTAKFNNETRESVVVEPISPADKPADNKDAKRDDMNDEIPF